MPFNKYVFFGSLLLSSLLMADTNCASFSTGRFTPDQISKVRPLAYGVAKDNGHNVVPSVAVTDNMVNICFTDATLNTTLISTTSLVTYYTNNPASLAVLTTQISNYETELSTTTQAIINGYNNFDLLTQAQINQGLKNVVRVLWLKQILGFQ